MSPALHEFLRLDLMAMLAGTLAALTCGLLGNFLVLRKLSLMGDAISHAVLPGLVAGFMITGARTSLPMFVGAAIAGLVTVLLVEVIRRLGRVEPGAAMGVSFSILFALGVVLIERAASHVDLDADCVLNGQMETIFWNPPADWGAFFTTETFFGEAGVPRQVWTLLVMFGVACAFVGLLFKELRIAAFDPELATTQGIHAGAMHVGLMVVVASATVASFEAVGSILVIAMLICPAAIARLLTDRLSSQIWVSLIAALTTGVVGYLAGARWAVHLGMPRSLDAAGMMTIVAGALLVLAIAFSPSHGLVARSRRRRRLARTVLLDDLIGALYRAREAGHDTIAPEALTETLHGHSRVTRGAAMARARGLIQAGKESLALTDAGITAGARVIRRHRLWEGYLVDRAGFRPDHVHDPAELLEHLDEPGVETPAPTIDPHGREIPGPDAAD